MMEKLLVIGGASTDTLHLNEGTVDCAGGAGMYTAMAAHRCGARVTMLGPRPEPCPEFLLPVASRLSEWIGPVVTPAQMPHFEISYQSGTTEYIDFLLESESLLKTDNLPAELSQFDHVHLVPLGDALNQLSFLRTCRQRGANQISAGTGRFIVDKQPLIVRTIMAESDIFFMNGREAEALFGSPESVRTEPGKILYITLGARGVLVIQGDTSAFVPAVAAQEMDPTGAGDTFCGATLAFLLQDEHPVMAARKAVALAAEMIGRVGPSALLEDGLPPVAMLDPRVQINERQVHAVARQITGLAEVLPFSFTGPVLPPTGHSQALEYFFAVTLQQFSFWSTLENHYHRPLIAIIDGRDLKGSDYLFYAYSRRLAVEPDFFSPERQATLTRQDMLDLFRADDGSDPMPALELHLREANRYGRDMLELQLTPRLLLQRALSNSKPLAAFLTMLDHIGGYKEDPLRKKSGLLALILNQRPEKILPLDSGEDFYPIIDYHLMRSCLRVGLIDVQDPALNQKLANREIVSQAAEWAVRYAAYQAIEEVVARSGKSNGAVDFFFFGARKRCPEMSEPECSFCQVDPVCAHRKEMFQPVLRTTFY